MWHGRVRTELRTLSAAPLNLGSGLSRETPALECFLSHTESRLTMKQTSYTELYFYWMHLINIHSALNAYIYEKLKLMNIGPFHMTMKLKGNNLRIADFCPAEI